MNPALSFVHKLADADLYVHVKESALGLIQDFWHDGEINPLASLFKGKLARGPVTSSAGTSSGKLWHAKPGEIEQIMWGENCLMPADIEISNKLISSVSLKNNMSVLDLSAGFGRRARQMVEDFDVLVTGLEISSDIAVLGMRKSIEANMGSKASIANYDVSTFKLSKSYDAIIARELLYRIEPKEAFLRSLAACANKNAFVSFTDYVVDPEQQTAAGIRAWLNFETQAKPIGLIQMGEIWAKTGFYLINQEDVTSLYKKQVLLGLKRLALFLSTSSKPDMITKRNIKRQLELWAHRMMAIESGMRLFRFLGVNHG